MSDSRLGVPVRLILDRSAVLAYLAGSVHVAETLHEVVHDRGVRFGVSAVVLAEAVHLSTPEDAQWIRALADLDACSVLPVFPTEWPVLAVWLGDLGRIDLAVSAQAAAINGAPILTSEPEPYKTAHGPQIISFPH